MYIKCKELNTFHHKSGELLVSDSKMYYGSKIAVCKIDEEDFDKLKQFGWSQEDWNNQIQQFKSEGCKLF